MQNEVGGFHVLKKAGGMGGSKDSERRVFTFQEAAKGKTSHMFRLKKRNSIFRFT